MGCTGFTGGCAPEEQQRLNAAACALVRCADGVPPNDPYYSLLKGLQDKGATYQNELETLRKTGEFVYIPRFDDISDFITRNSEYRQRAKGLSDLVAGTIGMVGGGGLAVGGLALCGPSAGASCATIPLGAFIAKTSNDQAQEGNQALFGAYRSTEGQRVIASFDIETYPGERIPLEEIGVEAGKRALIQVLGKYIPNILMGAEEGVLKRAASEVPGSTKISKNTEHAVGAAEISKVGNFADEAKLIDHFKRHGTEFGSETAEDYLKVGQQIMEQGQKVEYIYKGEPRTGFVQFMGNRKNGESKFGFVGTNSDGAITTIHIESGNSFWKMLNNGNIDKVINPKP
jgi:filamentous hemagglutinin